MIYSFCVVFKDHPSSQNWTLDFEPAFSPRFSPTLSPRSIFQTSQRFLLLNHVTSGSMSLRSLFHIAQRFPILKHVTSGSHEPAILFSTWSAVSPTGNDMTSSSGHVIALDQSGASIFPRWAHLTTHEVLRRQCLTANPWCVYVNTQRPNEYNTPR